MTRQKKVSNILKYVFFYILVISSLEKNSTHIQVSFQSVTFNHNKVRSKLKDNKKQTHTHTNFKALQEKIHSLKSVFSYLLTYP